MELPLPPEKPGMDWKSWPQLDQGRVPRSWLGLLGCMLFRLLQHFIMRRGLIFVIIRVHVIFAHRMVLITFPHQQTAQVGMAIKDGPVQIEKRRLLKFSP